MTLREALRQHVEQDDPFPLCQDLELDGSQFAAILYVTDGTTTRGVSFVGHARDLQGPASQFITRFMDTAVPSILDGFKSKASV